MKTNHGAMIPAAPVEEGREGEMSEPEYAQGSRLFNHADLLNAYATGAHDAATYSDQITDELILRSADAYVKSVAPAASRAPHEGPTSGLREDIAKVIYDFLRQNDSEGRNVSWVPGGNSLKQDDARRFADRVLAVLPAASPLAVENANG